MSWSFEKILRGARKLNASDVHLVNGIAPALRIGGETRLLPGLGRFRATLYYHAGCPEMAIRLGEVTIRGRDELRLPPIVDELTRLPDGLNLVTGPTGMG